PPPPETHLLSLPAALPIFREPRDTARVQRLPRASPVPALLVLGETAEQVHPPAVREAGREYVVPIHDGERPGLRLRAAIEGARQDRKSTRLNSSHVKISYA